MMRKIIFAWLFIWSMAQAEPQAFLGFGGGSLVEQYSSTSINKTVGGYHAKVTAGYGERTAYMVQIGLSYIEYDSNVFSPDDGYNLYLDVDLIKAFDFNIGFYPFVKAGFGAGKMKVARSVQSELGNGDFHLGAGVYVPLGKYVDIEFSFVSRGKNWEKINLIATQEEVTSASIEPYFGINFRY